MCYNYGITTIILQPIENSTTTTCTATATSVLPTVYDDDDDDHDGNEPKELESTADECFISRDENEPETLVQYAGGTCSKKRREWTRQFIWPKGFSPRTMNFLNGKTDVLTDAIRKEIVNALFSRYAIKYCIASQTTYTCMYTSMHATIMIIFYGYHHH